MAGYIGSKAVTLSTTAADVTGNAVINGDLTVKGTTVTIDSAAAQEIRLGDNDKMTFGDATGGDLQIYHDGFNSYIDDVGTGVLNIRAESYIALSDMSNKVYFTGTSGGAVGLRFNDAQKLATTATGVDITGTLTSDGLTVDGSTPSISNGTSPAAFTIGASNGASSNLILKGAAGMEMQTYNGGWKKYFNLAYTGDISFYEDTGTTAKFFWDASAESLGIGTSSPNSTGDETLHINAASYPTIHLTNSTSGTTSTDGVDIGINGTSMDMFIRNRESADIAFYTAAAERMRLDSSGNVDIGSTGGGTKLSIAGAVGTQNGTAAAPTHTFYSDTNTGMFRAAVDTLGFSTNAAERMRIDASGNLNLVSASSGLIDFNFTDASLNDYARIQGGKSGSGVGDLRFHTYSGGLSERMRIDASGNVLVGTTDTTPFNNNSGTSADFGFVVNKGGGYTSLASYNTTPLYINRTSSDGDIVNFRKDGTTVGSIGTYGPSVMYQGSSSAATSFGGGDTAINIDPVNNNIIPVTLASGSPAARDASIDLGRTTSRFKDLYLSGAITLNNASMTPVGTFGRNTDTSARTLFAFRSESQNATVGTIAVTNSATAYNTSSDYRLKENVVDLTGATDRIKQIPVHRFNFIADPDTTVDGFLAHEVQDIVPEAVTGAKDAMRDEEYEVTPAVLDDDGNVVTEAVMGTRSVPDYQGIDQSKLVPLLTAALQEALQEITDLKARVTALEAV